MSLRRRSRLLSFLCVWTASASAQPPQSPVNDAAALRVLSYNIHHGEGTDRRLDLQRVAAVINAVKPDVVALQEVDRRVARTGKVDQPAELAKLTEMEVVFGPNIELEGGHYGNAVLSRLPVASHKNHLLPCLDDGEQRGVLDVVVETAGGPVRLLATHLDHRRDDAERLASVTAIHELIAENQEQPVLLAGDLNASFDGEVLDRFRNDWTLANSDPLPTVPVDEPRRQIDFVLFRPTSNWRTVEARVLDEAVASDHRAILVVLERQAE